WRSASRGTPSSSRSPRRGSGPRETRGSPPSSRGPKSLDPLDGEAALASRDGRGGGRDCHAVSIPSTGKRPSRAMPVVRDIQLAVGLDPLDGEAALASTN